MRCDRGALEFTAALAPTKPARVEWLHWNRELPPDEPLTRAASSVTAAIGGTRESLAGVLAASADSAQIGKQLAHAAIDHGTCHIEHGTSNGERSRGTFLLDCQDGQLELSLELDRASQQITSVTLSPPRERGDTCWH